MTNLKLVLRTYSALRQMSPDDIALLETLRALNDGDRELMVETLQGKATGKKAATKTRTYQRCEQCDKTKGHAFHKDSSNDDYHIFQPPAPSSKSSQSSSKSPRASGMATVLNRNLKQRDPATKTDNWRCTHRSDGDSTDCGEAQSSLVHDPAGGYAHYHPFQPSTTAPPAPASLPANGAASATDRSTRRSAPPSTPESDDGESGNASLSTVGSGTQGDSVGTVAHGASGGD